MGLFTGIGDFFRGAFGEDEEEKRRRKEQERQAAQARATQNKPKPQPQTFNQQENTNNAVNNLFGKKDNTIADPLNVTKLWQQQPTKPKEQPKPAPKPTPQTDKQFMAYTEQTPENKKILGWNAAAILPKDYEKRTPIKFDRTITTNEDKYVAQFDSLSKEVKRILIDKAKEDAKNGNQVANNTLWALKRANRLDDADGDWLEKGASYASVPGRSIMRVATGIPEGVSGLYDLATPGTGTSRTSKFFGELGKNQDKSAKEAGVETAYKVMNVPTEIASYFIPSTLAVKIAGKFPKGAKLTEEIIEKVAKLTDDTGEAGKVRKFLADRMRKGWGLDEAIEESLISGRYIGQNAARGNDTSATSVATDVITGIGGGLLFPTRSVKRLMDDGNQADEVAGATLATGSEYIDNALTKNADNVAVDTEKAIVDMTDEELEALASDVDAPAFDRQKYKDELNRRAPGKEADIAKATGTEDTPVDTVPAYQFKQDIEDIVRRESEDFDEYIRSNPDLTMQQIEAAREEAKARIIKLTDELKESRYGTEAKLEAERLKNADQIEGQQATNAAVEAEQAAQTSPNPQDVVQDTPVSGSPEVAANNAYAEDVLFPDSPEYKGRDDLNLLQKISPDRIIREKITRPIEDMVNRIVAAAQKSNFAPARGVGRFFTGVNTEFGIDPALQAARQQLRGGVEYGKLLRERIADLNKNMTKEQIDRVWANLDPEQADRLGIKGGNMTEQELALHDKLKQLIDGTTAENLRRGLITPEAAQDGYIKRAYSVYDGNTEGISQFEQGFRQELLGQYKGRKQVSDQMVETAITDPSYLVGKKTAESNAMWAMQDYGNYLNSKGLAVPKKPNAGYTQLPDSPVFGEAAGKWVPRNVAEDFTGFQYNNAMVSAMADVMNVYDRWGVRQAKKQLLTIFNPAVRLGNQVSNRAIFSQLNGTNPLQFNKVFGEVDAMMKNGDPLYREAVQNGLTGIDITQADFYAQRIANATGDKNIAAKAVESLQKSYSRADDKARVAAYVVHRRRGYSPEEAARMVQRGFQDYKSVGFFYDMAAKTPIIGNAFVRFVADSMRIAKNAAVDHPLRTASTLAMWSMFTNGMSIISGEGRGDVDEQGNDTSSSLKGDTIPEQAFSLITGKTKGADQKAREGRFGAPVIPFTDISMTTQTPWGELNAARFMPWYSLNEIQDGAQKFLPISQSPVKMVDGKPEVNGAGFADPLLGQFFQLGFDKDFRNKSIADPDNTGQLDRDPLSSKDQIYNRLRFLFNNNAPLGRETDSVLSSYKKEITPFIGSNEGTDIYGKVRTPAQAWLRAMGIKNETYGDEQIADQKGTESYYKELEQIEADLKEMSPEAQEAWKRLTGYNKLREKVPNEFQEGEMRWKKFPIYDFPEDKWKDYSTHPELYELMMNRKIGQARERGEKVSPAFDPRLSEGFRRQLIENKIVAPGDDAELDQRMYADPEWDYYQTLNKAYKAQFDEDEFNDELVKHKTADFPEKPDILKQYGAQYGLYTKGQAEKPEFTDELKAAKEAYNQATFNWTNQEREARGLDAIVWDVWNNPTFGFDETPSGMGYGFGGGGNGSQREYQTNTMGNLSNYSDSVKRYDEITPQEMANLSQFFGKLQAGGGGGRTKPKIGASSTGL